MCPNKGLLYSFLIWIRFYNANSFLHFEIDSKIVGCLISNAKSYNVVRAGNIPVSGSFNYEEEDGYKMKSGGEDNEPLPPLPEFLTQNSSDNASFPSLSNLSLTDQAQRQIEEQQKQIDMLLKAMDSQLSEKSEKIFTKVKKKTLGTPLRPQEAAMSSFSVAPLRAMIFVDGTWLYYTIHERREGSCPIIAKYGRGWQEYYKLNWNELPRIISEVVQDQESKNGWFNANDARPVEISRVNVFTSVKKKTSIRSDRLKMFKEMESANYDVYMMETVGQNEKCIDIQLAVEMLHYATVPNAYDVAILLSGDKDFMPALIRTRQKARKVGIVSMKPSCNKALYETPNLVDYDVIWLDDYLDRLFVRLEKTRVSAGVSRFTVMKVIYDFIDKSGLPMVSSRDIGSYLKRFHVGDSDLQSEVKYNYRGLHLFIREANIFFITNRSEKIDPTDRSFWIGLANDAEDVLLAEARNTKFNQIEKDFFDSYSLELLDNREEIYGRSLLKMSSKSAQLPIDHSNKENSLAQTNLPNDITNQVNDLALKEENPPTKHDYSIYKVTQLKNICRERGLPVSGVKATLISRLEENDESNVINASRSTLEKAKYESAPKAQIDNPPSNYLLYVVKEYIQASGGTANSRELGRYLAANLSFSAREQGGIGDSALVELKNTYGSLVKFLDAFPGIFDRSEVIKTEGAWEFQVSAHN